jgi:hypothetical protein
MAHYTAQEAGEIAKTILAQMGGMRKLQTMIGAHNFGFEECDGRVSLKFNFKGSREHNVCKVILDPDDTYTFQLWKLDMSKGTCIKTHETTGVYCDMIISVFESETGLYLSL